MSSTQRWQDWLNRLLGVWLFLAPFFGGTTPMWCAAKPRA